MNIVITQFYVYLIELTDRFHKEHIKFQPENPETIMKVNKFIETCQRSNLFHGAGSFLKN